MEDPCSQNVEIISKCEWCVYKNIEADYCKMVLDVVCADKGDGVDCQFPFPLLTQMSRQSTRWLNPNMSAHSSSKTRTWAA